MAKELTPCRDRFARQLRPARLELRRALGLVLVVFAIPVLVLIGLYAAKPQRASKVLDYLRVWMEKNSRAITVTLCFAFGAFFLIRGLSGA